MRDLAVGWLIPGALNKHHYQTGLDLHELFHYLNNKNMQNIEVNYAIAGNNSITSFLINHIKEIKEL